MSQYDKINKLTGQVRSAQVALTTAVTALQQARKRETLMQQQNEALIAYGIAAQRHIERLTIDRFPVTDEQSEQYREALLKATRYLITGM